jgi:hypothetical protein
MTATPVTWLLNNAIDISGCYLLPVRRLIRREFGGGKMAVEIRLEDKGGGVGIIALVAAGFPAGLENVFGFHSGKAFVFILDGEGGRLPEDFYEFFNLIYLAAGSTIHVNGEADDNAFHGIGADNGEDIINISNGVLARKDLKGPGEDPQGVAQGQADTGISDIEG